MVFLPKNVLQAEVAQFSCEVASTRPLALTDTIPKVMASGLNDQLSALAARAVVVKQWGSIPGRHLADNIHEAASAMLSLSAVRFRSADVIFGEFKNAFPSLT